MTYSVVIPTRDRPVELAAVLRSLAAQTVEPSEVIIADASTVPMKQKDMKGLPVRYLNLPPSLAAQRNAAIAVASGEYILFCDDDIEIPPNYAETLLTYLKYHPDDPLATGMVIERWPDGSIGAFPPASPARILWNFIFKLSIWADLDRSQSSFFGSIAVQIVRSFLRGSRNGTSSAGWPRLTAVREPSFHCSVYGLGAAMLRREMVPNPPFDEILDESGIGDHYGLAMRFPGETPIAVLPGITAHHHRSQTGRMPAPLSAFRRILALDYFRQARSTHPRRDRAALLWSLLGQLIPAVVLMKKEQMMAIGRAGLLIASDSNPYARARLNGKSGPVNPSYT